MSFSIHIVAGLDMATSSVTATGSETHIITDKEVKTFGLDDKNLKEAVKKYFGQKPDDAYLHSPTPWGDLYKKYKWPEVKLVLEVESAEIREISSEPVIVKEQTFKNNSSVSATFKVEINETLTNTCSSNWSTGGDLTIGQKFEYGVGFLGTGAKGETSISYTQSWGIGGEHSKSFQVGTSTGVEVNLQPGQSVKAILHSNKGVMKVRIRYKAYLIGTTAVNYGKTYKNHHFWGLGIGSVMKGGNIINKVESTEDLEIGYYSNSSVEIVDGVNEKVLASHFLTEE